MPTTDNHGYNVPDEGTEEWHLPLNENFELLAADVEVRDVAENRDDYTPLAGAKFLATDTGVVSFGEGDRWVRGLALWEYVEPYFAGAAGNYVAGHPDNTVAADVSGSTVAGGGWVSPDSDNTNAVTADFCFVGGGASNVAGGGQNATVAGGLGNTADGRFATVAGGWNNSALARHATVGGGGPSSSIDARRVEETRNVVYDRWGTVAGGGGNQAGEEGDATDAEFATVGGGKDNTAGAGETTVAGGVDNVAGSRWAAVGGGSANEATAPYATVAGGDGNRARGGNAFVGGGSGNEATGHDAAVVGGDGNRATSTGAAVPGGADNLATGDYAFAAGRGSHADYDGSFVWSDSGSDGFRSTGPDQFLVDARGGVGVGIDGPQTQFHVRDTVAGAATLDNHVAAVDNDAGSGGDVLALRTNRPTPTAAENFVTFKGSGGSVGEIEGDGGGGVTLRSFGSDFAEYVPKRDPDESFEAGEVVGLRAGEATRATGDAAAAFVVSGQPIVLGNRPPDGAVDDNVVVALLGQVPVKVAGPVEDGDLLVAAGDGRARAADPGRVGADVANAADDSASTDADPTDTADDSASTDADPMDADDDSADADTAGVADAELVVGRALEATDDARGEVRALVGHASVPSGMGAGAAAGVRQLATTVAEQRETVEAQADRIEEQRETIDTLARRVEDQRATIDAQADRLAAQSDRIDAQRAAIDDLRAELDDLRAATGAGGAGSRESAAD